MNAFSGAKSICILRLSAVGDVCHTLPVIHSIKKNLPHASLTWIIGELEASLLGDVPGVEFITFNKRSGLSGYAKLRRELAGRKFDVLLQMQVALRASIAALCIKADTRIGFDRARARDFQWLFTNKRISARTKQHVMDGLFGFAEILGVTERDIRWDIPIPDEDRTFAETTALKDKPTLIISPCTSARQLNWRNWSADRYAAVADYANRRHGMQVILTGGPTEFEREYGRLIMQEAGVEITNLIGQTNLKRLLALLERATVLISPDSGPVHMANAVGTPVIGLYATSNPDRTGPFYNRGYTVNRYPDALKKYLNKTVDQVRWGQRVRAPQAMSLITTEDVTEKLDQVFNNS
ncbi:MAG: glycosyltransferase family 9 protein [Gammaproteobacteria bacterium]|nr:glycosyltransferase family 9 protein [Gammaproteobacteria bacterium]